MRNPWAMRRIILRNLYKHLQKEYSNGPSQEFLVGSQLTPHQIDAMCAFKSDPYLDELRGALVRLDDGTFGICIRCKGEISKEALSTNPVRRVCEDCERAMGCTVPEPVGVRSLV